MWLCVCVWSRIANLWNLDNLLLLNMLTSYLNSICLYISFIWIPSCFNLIYVLNHVLLLNHSCTCVDLHFHENKMLRKVIVCVVCTSCIHFDVFFVFFHYYKILRKTNSAPKHLNHFNDQKGWSEWNAMHAKLTVLKYKFTKWNFPMLDQASFWQSSGTLRLYYVQ